MGWLETLRLALDAIVAHRVRSILTTLGITIGIAAVTLSVGMAQGATSSVSDEIGSLGSNLLTVSSGMGFAGPGASGPVDTSAMTPLSMADADALADRDAAPDIAGVAPVVQTGFEVSTGEKAVGSMAEASTPSWLSVRSRTMNSGSFFSQEQYDEAAPVAVLGSSLAGQLFGAPQAAVGNTVTASGTSFLVIGVLEPAGTSGGMMNSDDLAVLPLTTYRERLSAGDDPLSTIYVQAASPERLTQAYQETESLLVARRGVATAQDAGIMIMSQQSLVEAIAQITNILTLLLGGIAAISLIVGGIGVMNIMLVSVSERVREIGLRKALGARRRAILGQFLTEAAVLALVGGVFGLALTAGVAWLITTLAKFPVPLSIPTILMALAVSATIGLVAGVYPAARAAGLAPIDALRRE